MSQTQRKLKQRKPVSCLICFPIYFNKPEFPWLLSTLDFGQMHTYLTEISGAQHKCFFPNLQFFFPCTFSDTVTTDTFLSPEQIE